ncbi:MAG TPA: SpoIIE family protein phosphatase [Saprospiraceae bacterium]|nr:SpoIIE family protein phosphatase [Saprospiraceae bacterium]
MNRDFAILEKLENELNLKQLQIKSLLTITQAINDNISADGLYNMYKSFLSWEMEIDKMALFIKGDDLWTCVTIINTDMSTMNEIIPHFIKFNRLHTIKEGDHFLLKEFDIIIPVFHKQLPLAYALIGGIKESTDLYNKIQFITTITNIIAVAIENKRLFKRQLAQERYKKEMELAGDVQKMLIPDHFPKGDHYEISKIYKPHFNIGGDYLDFIPFDKNKFAFCIADISGKGVAAALLMANFQAIIQALIHQYRDLETFIFALNESVFRITRSDKYITFFIAEVDITRRKLKYINAGHYPPVLINGGKMRRLSNGTTIIGAFEKLPSIREEVISLENEAFVFCFTDGLVDLQNEKGDHFSDEIIEKQVQTHWKLSADEFNKKLMQEIETFRGNQEFFDDIAILTCKIY